MIPNWLSGRTVAFIPASLFDLMRLAAESAPAARPIDKLVVIPVIVSPYMPVGYIAIVHNGEIVGVYTYAD